MPVTTGFGSFSGNEAAPLDAVLPTPGEFEKFPLSYSQRQLWFFDRLKGASAEYNLPEALLLRGKRCTTGFLTPWRSTTSCLVNSQHGRRRRRVDARCAHDRYVDVQDTWSTLAWS
jgi:hypothetical protein